MDPDYEHVIALIAQLPAIDRKAVEQLLDERLAYLKTGGRDRPGLEATTRRFYEILAELKAQ